MDHFEEHRALYFFFRPDVQDIFHVLPDTGSAKKYHKAADALTRQFVTQVKTQY